MCMNCGCGMPEERHGKDANITASDIRAAGRANGQSFRESVEHIEQTGAKVEGGSGSGGGTSASGQDASGGAGGRDT